jgi:hypothetical protein
VAHHAGILMVPQAKKYGVDWRAEEIALSVIVCLQQCSLIAGHPLRCTDAGWEGRAGRDWLSCG